MKIRNQLILGFLLLAILPLAGIVLYSYWTSSRAVRQAVEAEAGELTREMEGRMTAVGEDLKRRVARVGSLPLHLWVPESEEVEPGIVASEEKRQARRIVTELGEAAPLIDSLEFIPAPEAEPAQGAPSAPPHPSLPGEVERRALHFDIPRMIEQVEIELRGFPEGPERDLALERAEQGLRVGALAAERIVKMVEELTQGEIAVRPREAPQAPDARRTRSEREARAAEGKAMAEEVERQEAEVSAGRERMHEQLKDLEGEWELRLGMEEDLKVPLLRGGTRVGEIKTRLRGEEILRGVLERTRREQGEIPFAVDSQGRLFTINEEDRSALQELDFFSDQGAEGGAGTAREHEDWVVVTSDDSGADLTFGIARPIRRSLAEIRRTAVRNLAYGAGLILIAVVGILPLSHRLTRDLQRLTEGAEKIAAGDLEARVATRSTNEVGLLARTFNRMAEEVQEHQRALLAEEERRRDEEVERQILQAEYERKSRELEEARSFQLSLLPSSLPRHPAFELAVSMKTATEVGGDYYDFRLEDGGSLTCAVGDATGHGAKAGTMVTVIKSLFSTYPSDLEPDRFLERAARGIRRMELGRMAMALTLARLQGRRLTLAAAGMPPALLFRADGGRVEELALQAMPLGGLQMEYGRLESDVGPGDLLLLMTDGLPELPDEQGDPFGYQRVRELFGEVGTSAPQDVLDALAAAAESWAGGRPPQDDLTFVAIRVA